MAKQRAELYVATTDATPRCIVDGCAARVVAEVHDDDYAAALHMLRNKKREKMRARRNGDERIYICATHRENDSRMARVRWRVSTTSL